MKAALLPDRGVVKVGGNDARDFLNGLVTTDITLLQPIGFLSLLWNALLGYFLFAQQPDIWTFAGAAVIFSSAMYISHREAVRRAQIKSGDAQAGQAA